MTRSRVDFAKGRESARLAIETMKKKACALEERSNTGGSSSGMPREKSGCTFGGGGRAKGTNETDLHFPERRGDGSLRNEETRESVVLSPGFTSERGGHGSFSRTKRPEGRLNKKSRVVELSEDLPNESAVGKYGTFRKKSE